MPSQAQCRELIDLLCSIDCSRADEAQQASVSQILSSMIEYSENLQNLPLMSDYELAQKLHEEELRMGNGPKRPRRSPLSLPSGEDCEPQERKFRSGKVVS